MRSQRISERCEQVSERMSEWPDRVLCALVSSSFYPLFSAIGAKIDSYRSLSHSSNMGLLSNFGVQVSGLAERNERVSERREARRATDLLYQMK